MNFFYKWVEDKLIKKNIFHSKVFLYFSFGDSHYKLNWLLLEESGHRLKWFLMDKGREGLFLFVDFGFNRRT